MVSWDNLMGLWHSWESTIKLNLESQGETSDLLMKIGLRKASNMDREVAQEWKVRELSLILFVFLMVLGWGKRWNPCSVS